MKAISQKMAGADARESEELAIVRRFLEVAETMIELTVERSPGLTPEEAVAEIRKRAGEELDPDAVDAVVRAFEEEDPPRGEAPFGQDEAALGAGGPARSLRWQRGR